MINNKFKNTLNIKKYYFIKYKFNFTEFFLFKLSSFFDKSIFQNNF